MTASKVPDSLELWGLSGMADSSARASNPTAGLTFKKDKAKL